MNKNKYMYYKVGIDYFDPSQVTNFRYHERGPRGVAWLYITFVGGGSLELEDDDAKQAFRLLGGEPHEVVNKAAA